MAAERRPPFTRGSFNEWFFIAHDPEKLRNLIGGDPLEIPEKRLTWAFFHRMFTDATYRTTQTSPHEQVQAIKWFYDRSEQPFGYSWTVSILDVPEEMEAEMFKIVRNTLHELKDSKDRFTQGALRAYFSRAQV